MTQQRRSPPAPLALAAFVALAAISGGALTTRRELGHLAIWRLSETTSRASFALPPHAASAVARDRPGNAPDRDELELALAVARDLVTRCAHPSRTDAVRWRSVADMREQIREGAIADCWPRSLLFAAEARGQGLETRLWALEGDRFDGNAHTIPEVWLPKPGRWAMLDVTMNAYVRDSLGMPIGFLEMRDLLFGPPGDTLNVVAVAAASNADRSRLVDYWRARARYAFLRQGEGLEVRSRYGAMAPLARWLDRLPEGPKKALASLVGETGTVLFYRDAHNAGLARAAFVARLCLFIFIVSLLGALALATRLVFAWRPGGERSVAERVGAAGRRALRWSFAAAAAVVLAYFAYAAVYTFFSRPPSGVWTFSDSFESGDLRAFARPGMRQLCCDHSAEVVTAPVRDGRRALRVCLLASDRGVRGNHRAELRLRSTRPGSENDYSFSVFLPADWRDDSVQTIVAQWHAVPDRWRGEAYLPSPLQLEVERGRWQLSCAWDPRPVIRRPFGHDDPRGRAYPIDLPLEKGRWVDWSFHVRWACDSTGILRVTKDGVEVVHRKGPNCYNDAIAPYFKFGIYRPTPPGPFAPGDYTIYFDAIRVRQGI